MTHPPQEKVYRLTYQQAVVARTELTDALDRWQGYLAARPDDWRIPTRRIAVIREILAVLPPPRPSRALVCGPDQIRQDTAPAPCCELHNQHCEPPGDLCCRWCTEAAHDTVPARHADSSPCVLPGQP